MRRIASVLASKRSDKPDSPNNAHPRSASKSSTRRFFGTLTRITVSTDRSSQPTASEPAHSSSASSTGSVSLRTPDDDRIGQLAPHVARSSSSRRAWIPWLNTKKSDLRGQSSSHPPSSYWLDSSGPIPQSSTAVDNQPAESDEETSDESSSSESESPSPSLPVSSRADKPQPDPHLPPVNFVASLTMNNIPPAFSPPPLLHYSNAPLFPRSSNSMRRLTFCDTIESTMHRKRLLNRLHSLTPADRRLLAAIGPRTLSAAQRRTLLQPEEGERYDLKHVKPFSVGLRQWIARPYFEERTVLWVPDDAGTVVWTTVKGSGFGVWALDVPETLELLAGYDNFDMDDVQPGSQLPPPSNDTAALTSLPVTGKHVPYKAVPSPLRYDRGPSEPPTPPSSTEAMTPTSTSTLSSSRRGVRFAESVDKEDQVPLGYILRHKKRREEKALFIQQEHERRQHEEERQKHEAERQQWEQEKRQWQKEKRALEEAKRQKHYAEEISAARARRESHNALPTSQTREQDRKPRESYSRPAYDPRKQPEHSSQTRSLRSRNDSSSSSRQGSLPRSESAGPHASRPTSTYSISSSEARVPRNSRRGSMISESSQRSVASPYFAYGWPPVPPISQIPPIPVFPAMQVIPVMPQFTMDTPLLPPTAPFMRQQYGRSRSRDSPPTSSARSSPGERPQRSSEPVPPKPRHHRSSSDEYNGRNSPALSLTLTNNSSTHLRSAYPKRTEASLRTSLPSSTTRQTFIPRRQTAIS